VVCIFDEARDLTGRFATAASDIGESGIAKIGAVKLPNAVIGKAGALPNRAGPGFVADHSKCQFELAPLARITIICESHILLFVLDIDHIQWQFAIYHP
jgi:hypothetical protein